MCGDNHSGESPLVTPGLQRCTHGDAICGILSGWMWVSTRLIFLRLEFTSNTAMLSTISWLQEGS